MRRTPIAMPTLITDQRAGVGVAFVGRSGSPKNCSEDALAEELTSRGVPTPRPWIRARQVHSDRVVEARPGKLGEADGLWTNRSDCTLLVVTADCVPVLLAGPSCVAAVHAGWRGLASGVLGNMIQALVEDPSELTAWIGPAIGSCCYEVSDEIAQLVAVRSGREVVHGQGPGRRPHLDLQASARLQLAATGVHDCSVFPHCTGCRSDQWWSHRRGAEGGRNYSLIWRRR